MMAPIVSTRSKTTEENVIASERYKLKKMTWVVSLQNL